MNKANSLVGRIKLALGIALLAVLSGCIGVVGDDGDDVEYDDEVVVPGPDLFIFGGGFDRGRDAHDYSHRGHESRAAARPARGGHERASHGGGGHEGRR